MIAGEVGPGFRTDLGLIGARCIFPVRSLRPCVRGGALSTVPGRRKLGFISLGSTAGTLLVGILISLAAISLSDQAKAPR
jgi:hypothetical protein